MKLIGRDGAGLAVTVETVRIDGRERLLVKHGGFFVGNVRLSGLETTLKSIGVDLKDMEDVTRELAPLPASARFPIIGGRAFRYA